MQWVSGEKKADKKTFDDAFASAVWIVELLGLIIIVW